MLRIFLRLQRWFFANEARVFSRATRREKWIERKRFKRRIIYVILFFSAFFLLLDDMHQDGTIIQSYLDHQREKAIERELEEFYKIHGYIEGYYDDD